MVIDVLTRRKQRAKELSEPRYTVQSLLFLLNQFSAYRRGAKTLVPNASKEEIIVRILDEEIPE